MIEINHKSYQLSRSNLSLEKPGHTTCRHSEQWFTLSLGIAFFVECLTDSIELKVGKVIEFKRLLVVVGPFCWPTCMSDGELNVVVCTLCYTSNSSDSQDSACTLYCVISRFTQRLSFTYLSLKTKMSCLP